MAQLDVVYPRIEAALTTVADEIEIAESETEAFRAFQSHLRRLEPVETSTSAGGGCLVETTTVAGVDPSDVRTAYRDTVLAMYHYDRDYNEPLLVNVGAEFGTSVRQLVAGSVPIPPVQLGAVEAAAEHAIEERQRFQRALEDERDSLETVARRLGKIERRLHQWRQERGSNRRHQSRANSVEAVGFGSGREERLRGLAEDCQSLSAERQRAIHGGPAMALSGIGDRSMLEYLYGETDHRFPALAEVADVAERIQTAMGGKPSAR